MRVGLLTSWRVPCGVYQYSARLADALAKIPDVTPVILAGRADESRSVPEESTHEVHDFAEIGLWRDDQQYGLNFPALLDVEPPDVLHVQYQSMLFTQPDLARLCDYCGDIPKVITYHDNCQRPDFPYDLFDLHFSHRWNVGPMGLSNSEVIPFGVENRPPVVRSFGLGRSRDDYIAPICERNGWIFESASTNEPIHGVVAKWRTHDELISWLRGADAIVLWYDEQGMAGASQAARTAMAARRPLFTNDTKWFEELPKSARGYHKAHDLIELESMLRGCLSNRYLEENSWDSVAQLLVRRYEHEHERQLTLKAE